MTFAQALQSVFQNYANFNGRARRSEYWYFVLLNCLISLLSVTPLLPLVGLYSLAVLLPTLAAASRRLHDTGRSGLWLLLMLAAPVGTVVLIVWLCEDGKPGSNQYGPDPKGRRAPVNAAEPVRKPAPPYVGHVSIRCLSGPLMGQTYLLPGPYGNQLLFGRAADCSVRFPDGTPGVSGHHCVLRYNDRDELILEDLQSTYGTFLGSGRRLPPNYPERVGGYERFFLGGTNVMFDIMPCT